MYHMVRFFERVMVERRLARARMYAHAYACEVCSFA
jgi:predicted RNA-binding Zn-ribbon protein involved in translation (DUF1610 family)